MRAWVTIILAFGSAVVLAQNFSANHFLVPNGQSTYTVTAGATVELQWASLEGSTVTIKLQNNGQITPDTGDVLAQSIPNTGKTIVQIPSSADIPAGTYTFEIIDDSETSTINFSPPFGILSASGTGSFGGLSATGTASASTASGSSQPLSTVSGPSSAAATTSGGGNSSSTSAPSSTLSSTASLTAAASTAAVTTTAPSGNSGWRVQAPMAAVVMIGAAVLL